MVEHHQAQRRGRVLGGVRPTDEGDRVTTFELFFDLVSVFAATQATGYMAHEHSGYGVPQGLLVLALLWWTWSAYAWLGNQARADEGLVRAGMAVAMAAIFVVALTIPEAWQDAPGGLDGPLVLVGAYLVVRCVHLILYGVAATLLASAALLIPGVLLGGSTQTLLFAAALLVDWVGVWLISRYGNSRGRVDRRTVRQAPRGGRGLRCPGGDRPVPGRGQRAVGGRETGDPVRVRGLLSDLPAVAAPPTAAAAGPATAVGRDRQPDAERPVHPELQRAVRPGAQHQSGVDRPATGAQRPRPRHHRPPVAGIGPHPGPWQDSPDLDVVQTGAWILPDERPLPADLEAFLDAGTPPVYVGFGSMRAPTDVARVAIEAIRSQGRRALLARGWVDLALIDDRDDCFAVGEVNQQQLFGRVAAVVHHGGAGTATTAARAGAPQVVVPQMADQPYFAGRVAELGIGTAHGGPTPTTESLSAALRTTLTPETRARAAAVAATIRSDGATVAATLLLDAVSRERLPMSA